MQQNQHPHPNSQDDAFDRFGDIISGGYYTPVKSISTVLFEALAFSLIIPTRVRIGFELFTLKLHSWTGAVFLIIFLIAFNNCSPEQVCSLGWVVFHWQIFFCSLVIKAIIARFTLGSSNPRWYRHRYSIGESMIYPLVAWLCKYLGLLEANPKRPKSYFKLTHRRWILYWEPLLFLAIGFGFNQAGYVVYGYFTWASTASLFVLTSYAYRNTDTETQLQREASEKTEMFLPTKEENEEEEDAPMMSA